MTEPWERDRPAVRGFVERVAAEYAAGSVVVDADLGDVAGDSRDVCVVLPGEEVPDAEPADLIVSIDAPARTAGWAEYLVRLAKRTRKGLVVVVGNGERLWRRGGLGTTALAGVLWRVGRVREHAYLGVPHLFGASQVVQVPAGLLVRRTARLHAFVVDTAPRTPQARRRLRMVGEVRGA